VKDPDREPARGNQPLAEFDGICVVLLPLLRHETAFMKPDDGKLENRTGNGMLSKVERLRLFDFW